MVRTRTCACTVTADQRTDGCQQSKVHEQAAAYDALEWHRAFEGICGGQAASRAVSVPDSQDLSRAARKLNRQAVNGGSQEHCGSQTWRSRCNRPSAPVARILTSFDTPVLQPLIMNAYANRTAAPCGRSCTPSSFVGRTTLSKSVLLSATPFSSRKCSKRASVTTRAIAQPAPPPTAKTSNPLNLIWTSAEVAPWSKTGGLGDVVGGLPLEMARRGHKVMTIAPRCAAPANF